jgi:hypothetical protein
MAECSNPQRSFMHSTGKKPGVVKEKFLKPVPISSANGDCITSI